MAAATDKPAAALVKDLKARGLFEDTLLIWTTEFGRMPFSQGSTGRDHNGGTFISWIAGAGVKRGVANGEIGPRHRPCNGILEHRSASFAPSLPIPPSQAVQSSPVSSSAGVSDASLSASVRARSPPNRAPPHELSISLRRVGFEDLMRDGPGPQEAEI